MTDKTAPIARYQVARFAEWLELGPKRYSFQLTPASLAKATQSGLSTRHLLSLLRKYGKSASPPTLLKALNRWQEHGAEASIETLTILRLKSPEILQALKDSDANTWLGGESLSPVAVVVKPGGVEKVQQALARLGYLSDLEIQSPKNEQAIVFKAFCQGGRNQTPSKSLGASGGFYLFIDGTGWIFAGIRSFIAQSHANRVRNVKVGDDLSGHSRVSVWCS